MPFRAHVAKSRRRLPRLDVDHRKIPFARGLQKLILRDPALPADRPHHILLFCPDPPPDDRRARRPDHIQFVAAHSHGCDEQRQLNISTDAATMNTRLRPSLRMRTPEE